PHRAPAGGGPRRQRGGRQFGAREREPKRGSQLERRPQGAGGGVWLTPFAAAGYNCPAIVMVTGFLDRQGTASGPRLVVLVQAGGCGRCMRTPSGATSSSSKRSRTV